MNKIRIIHITTDNKFFDGPFKQFEAIKLFDNKAYLSKFGVQKLHYIKSSDKITLLENKKDLKSIFEEGCYDVVFFYSLASDRWWMVDTIPKDKIIIWWEWGAEIYGSNNCLAPLINISLYKPLTNSYNSRRVKIWAKTILQYCRYGALKSFLERKRNQVLARIDYLMPVLPIDYELLCRHMSFRAQQFYYPTPIEIFEFSSKQHISEGGILIGNSATATNNHLDIWEKLKEIPIKNRKIIVPLSYGDKDLANFLSTKLVSQVNEVVCLRKFLDLKTYFELTGSCSYAIFGMMRQQAIGNVRQCIRDGIKVFLYKDSVVYKSLKKSGFIVYTIEDMTIESLSTPMSPEDIRYNHNLFRKEVEEKNKIFNDVVEQIKNKLQYE